MMKASFRERCQGVKFVYTWIRHVWICFGRQNTQNTVARQLYKPIYEYKNLFNFSSVLRAQAPKELKNLRSPGDD